MPKDSLYIRLDSHPAPRWRRVSIALAICVGLGLSLAVFAVLRGREQRQIQMKFDHEADARTSLIEFEFKSYFQELAALGRFYDGSKFVDREEFRQFVGPVLARHSGIRAFEWIPRVTAAQRPAHEQTVREDGIEEYQIGERSIRGGRVRAADRPEYFPVAYAEPHEDTRTVLGFDCGSVPAQRAALIGRLNTPRPADVNSFIPASNVTMNVLRASALDTEHQRATKVRPDLVRCLPAARVLSGGSHSRVCTRGIRRWTCQTSGTGQGSKRRGQ